MLKDPPNDLIAGLLEQLIGKKHWFGDGGWEGAIIAALTQAVKDKETLAEQEKVNKEYEEVMYEKAEPYGAPLVEPKDDVASQKKRKLW